MSKASIIGAYNTEFQGIWYLGIITSCLAAAAGLYVIYRERVTAGKVTSELPEAV